MLKHSDRFMVKRAEVGFGGSGRYPHKKVSESKVFNGALIAYSDEADLLLC